MEVIMVHPLFFMAKDEEQSRDNQFFCSFILARQMQLQEMQRQQRQGNYQLNEDNIFTNLRWSTAQNLSHWRKKRFKALLEFHERWSDMPPLYQPKHASMHRQNTDRYEDRQREQYWRREEDRRREEEWNSQRRREDEECKRREDDERMRKEANERKKREEEIERMRQRTQEFMREDAENRKRREEADRKKREEKRKEYERIVEEQRRRKQQEEDDKRRAEEDNIKSENKYGNYHTYGAYNPYSSFFRNDSDEDVREEAKKKKYDHNKEKAPQEKSQWTNAADLTFDSSGEDENPFPEPTYQSRYPKDAYDYPEEEDLEAELSPSLSVSPSLSGKATPRSVDGDAEEKKEEEEKTAGDPDSMQAFQLLENFDFTTEMGWQYTAFRNNRDQLWSKYMWNVLNSWEKNQTAVLRENVIRLNAKYNKNNKEETAIELVEATQARTNHDSVINLLNNQSALPKQFEKSLQLLDTIWREFIKICRNAMHGPISSGTFGSLVWMKRDLKTVDDIWKHDMQHFQMYKVMKNMAQWIDKKIIEYRKEQDEKNRKKQEEVHKKSEEAQERIRKQREAEAEAKRQEMEWKEEETEIVEIIVAEVGKYNFRGIIRGLSGLNVPLHPSDAVMKKYWKKARKALHPDYQGGHLTPEQYAKKTVRFQELETHHDRWKKYRGL